MQALPAPVRTCVGGWTTAAQQQFHAIRAIALEVAQHPLIGPLDECLKWRQPAWRPRTPRTGSTLRVNWTHGLADALMVYVDCKTDLAGQMSTRFPDQFHNDGRRSLRFDLAAPLPGDAIRQLAYLTFTYHLART